MWRSSPRTSNGSVCYITMDVSFRWALASAMYSQSRGFGSSACTRDLVFCVPKAHAVQLSATPVVRSLRQERPKELLRRVVGAMDGKCCREAIPRTGDIALRSKRKAQVVQSFAAARPQGAVGHVEFFRVRGKLHSPPRKMRPRALSVRATSAKNCIAQRGRGLSGRREGP